MRTARLAALFVPAGAPPTPFLEPGAFTATWEGDVTVDLGTDCTFSAQGRGKLSIALNGELALACEGEDLSIAKGQEIFLKKGRNRLVIRYQSPPSGDAALRVFWESFDWSREALHPTRLRHDANAAGLRAARQRRQGRELLAQRRCLNCHDHEPTGMAELALDAPSLTDVGARLHPEWMAHWLRDPQSIRADASMPKLPNLTDQDAADIAAFLTTQHRDSAGSVAFTADDAERGKALFIAMRCIGCHTRPDGDPAEDRIALDLVAAKWRPTALIAFLQVPERHYQWIEMPNFGLTAEQAGDLAAFLLDASTGTLTGEPLPIGDAERGKTRIQTLGCLSCHACEGLTDQSDAPTLASIAPAAWQRGCLAEDPRDAPDFAFSKAERDAILAFAATDLRSLARSDPIEFATRQIKALRCVACHRRDDQYDLWTDLREEMESGDVERDDQEFVLTQQAEPFVPALTWAGEKLRPEWLSAFLRGDIQQRPRPFLGLLRMPHFATRATLLAQGMAFEHGLPPTGMPVDAPDPTLSEIGRTLAGPNRGLDCLSCHGIGDRAATKVFEAPAPNFKFARDRLRKEYFIRWIDAPGQVEPGTRMPQFFPEGQSFLTEILGGDARQQIEALWHYVLEGENIRPPE